MPVTSGADVQNTSSFGSTVDERTKNKLYGVKCWVHKLILVACLARQWIKERGIIDVCIREESGPVLCSLAALGN